MAIYKFDTSELISFIAAFIGLLVIAYIYFFKQKKEKKSMLSYKFSLKLMLIIFLLMFLNRFFTNIEAVAYKDSFNLLEHLSSLTMGVAAIIFSWNFQAVRKFRQGSGAWFKSAAK